SQTPSGGSAENFFDRVGIPRPLRWGCLGVLIFMTGNGIESNFVSPHIAGAFGGGRDRIDLAAESITACSLAVLLCSYRRGALSDLWGPRRVMALGFAVWVVFEMAFLGSLALHSIPLVAISYFLRGFGFPLFAFAFLVWVNAVVRKERNGAAVGWFYVMFKIGRASCRERREVMAVPVAL